MLMYPYDIQSDPDMLDRSALHLVSLISCRAVKNGEDV